MFILKMEEEKDIIREVVKVVLVIMHEDKNIDCNEYQGTDFDRLMRKVKDYLVEARQK